MNTNENEMYGITFADVEQTAREFGRLAVHHPRHEMVIIMDDIFWGPGFFKQFDDGPKGLAEARRYAVRLEEGDEMSSEPFEALRDRINAELEAYARSDGDLSLLSSPKEQSKALRKEANKRGGGMLYLKRHVSGLNAQIAAGANVETLIDGKWLPCVGAPNSITILEEERCLLVIVLEAGRDRKEKVNAGQPFRSEFNDLPNDLRAEGWV